MGNLEKTEKTYKIKTINNNVRMSTQDLLQLIYQKIDEGYCDFEIDACGQHNIGGSVWSKSGNLTFKVRNPGQRLGGMAMSGTKIVVEGSAPADVGWLNSGADIVVKGDGGDTTAHCAASGKIYIGGRAGTRSGAMMKHDPKFTQPEFWVLKNVGSFSFEFMGGGVAVVCGHDCSNLESVLGHRSCVGMVGGIIYFRGNYVDVADCVEVLPLEDFDRAFLQTGIEEFLNEVDCIDVHQEFLDFGQWKKIVPKAKTSKEELISMSEFRVNKWVDGGIFGDFVEDDLMVYEIAASDKGRLNIPIWDKESCIGCNICLNNCPKKAILDKDKEYISLNDNCIGCGICEAVCPKSCWKMQANEREIR